MLRTIAAAGAAVVALTLGGCGHRTTAAPSADGATLASYVMDSAAPTASPSPAPAGRAGQAGQSAPAVCSSGQDAYRVLLFLVSGDTGTPVQQIVSDLRAGRSLDDVAGAHTGQVKSQAMGLVRAWLQFAEANGRITVEQGEQYGAVASVAIDALMAANVQACLPAVS